MKAMKMKEAIEILKKAPHFPHDKIGAKEAIDISIEVMEKAEKYRWHDLRKNPDDLPKENGDYIVWYQAVNNVYNGAKVMFYSTGGGWLAGRTRKEEGVIAWREIEPFEREVEE